LSTGRTMTFMKADTSAKKIGLFLIGFSITTILTSMIAFPFQSVVNAASKNAAVKVASTPGSGCVVKEKDLSKSKFPKDNPTYSGILTTNSGKSIATFEIQFTGTPGKLTKVELLNIKKQQTPDNGNDFVEQLEPKFVGGDTLTSLSFGVTDPDGKAADLLLFNGTFHSGKNRITGSWIINSAGSKIDQYNGLWDVTLSGATIPTPGSGCAIKEKDLSKSKFPVENPTYSGILTTNTGITLASIEIKFTGTPEKLTKVELNILKKEQVPNGVNDFVEKLNPQPTSGILTSLSFGVTDPDGKAATLLLFNTTLRSSNKMITGSWIINSNGDKINAYNGFWNVTLK